MKSLDAIMSKVNDVLTDWKEFFESVDEDIDSLGATLSALSELKKELTMAEKFTRDIHGKLKKLSKLWKR